MLGSIATEIIRNELSYPGLLIGVTGNALDEDILDFLNRGADEVIVKPLTKEIFVDTLLAHREVLLSIRSEGRSESRPAGPT